MAANHLYEALNNRWLQVLNELSMAGIHTVLQCNLGGHVHEHALAATAPRLHSKEHSLIG